MAEYRRKEIVSGAFILMALFVFMLFAFKVGGLDLFWFMRGETRSFEILLPDVKGLEKGAKVTFGGRRVGKITRISLALPADVERFKARYLEVWGSECEDFSREERATFMMMRVVFEVEEEEVRGEEGEPFRIHGPTASVVLLQEGLLGGHFLQLHPGLPEFWDEARPIFGEGAPESGGPLPLRGRSEDLLDVVRQEIRPTLRRVETLLDKVNEGILSDTNIGRLERMLADLEDGVHGLKEFAEDLPTALGKTRADVTEKLIEPLGRLIRNADGTITRLREELVERIVANAEAILSQGTLVLASAEKTIAEANRMVTDGGPEAVAVLGNLKTVTARLDGRLDALQGQLVSILGRMDLLVAENRSEVSETLQSLKRAAWETEMLMRKVRSNPALVLFGDDEKDLEALPFDEAGLRRSGRARPYKQRDEKDD